MLAPVPGLPTLPVNNSAMQLARTLAVPTECWVCPMHQMLQRHRMRLGRIAAPDDLRLGVADVVEAVGHRAVAPGVGHAGDGCRMADSRLVIGVVGAPEGTELAEQVGAFVGEFGG